MGSEGRGDLPDSLESKKNRWEQIWSNNVLKNIEGKIYRFSLQEKTEDLL